MIHRSFFHYKRDMAAWLAVGLYTALVLLSLPLTPFLWATLLSFLPFPLYFTPLLALLPPLGILISLLLRQDAPSRAKFGSLGGLALLSLWVLLLLAETPAEMLHLPEYGALSYLTLRALHPPSHRAYLLCFLFVLLVGSIDETLQSFLPNRVFELKDIGLNAFCGAVGLAARALVAIKPQA